MAYQFDFGCFYTATVDVTLQAGIRINFEIGWLYTATVAVMAQAGSKINFNLDVFLQQPWQCSCVFELCLDL